jgi:hypothetical protein
MAVAPVVRQAPVPAGLAVNARQPRVVLVRERDFSRSPSPPRYRETPPTSPSHASSDSSDEDWEPVQVRVRDGEKIDFSICFFYQTSSRIKFSLSAT